MYADEFLDLATNLCKNRDAASIRSAVSRAYYAAFLAARDWITSLRVSIDQDGAAHRQVVEALKGSGDEYLDDAGSILHSLRTSRRGADYEISILAHEAPALAGHAVADAREVIDTINSYRSKTDRELVAVIVSMQQAVR